MADSDDGQLHHVGSFLDINIEVKLNHGVIDNSYASEKVPKYVSLNEMITDILNRALQSEKLAYLNPLFSDVGTAKHEYDFSDSEHYYKRKFDSQFPQLGSLCGELFTSWEKSVSVQIPKTAVKIISYLIGGK